MDSTERFADFLLQILKADGRPDLDKLDNFICSHLAQFNHGNFGIPPERANLRTVFIAKAQDADLSSAIIDTVIDRISNAPFE